MLKHYLIIVIVLCGLCDIYSGSLPPDIDRCKVLDNVCIMKAMNDVIRLYPNGNPSFGLIDLTQIKLQKLIISDSARHFDLTFENAVVTGIENIKVVSVSGFDPSISKIVVNLEIQNGKLNGDYKVNGNILRLQLKGQGKAEMKSTRCMCKLMIDVKLEKRNGKNYLAIKRMKAELQPKDFHIRLDNLFDGNKELTDSINETLNKNWRDFWNELRDDFGNAFVAVVQNILDNVFKELSYDDFYIN
uniref:Uncharacterized protein n=1 Tax=Glossina brevipalpis TaxID=37001 RepID=A0A1A9W3V1_9MUSC